MARDERVDPILLPFKLIIGEDYERYRNHVQRVYLNCLLLDPSEEHAEKYAIAAVFHDIGIWTHHTFNYLAPSITQAANYLERTGKTAWIDEITQMIYWHHKLSACDVAIPPTIEVFRKADWIDVSLGLISFSADRKRIAQYRRELPNKGFHWFLIGQSFSNFVKHPLRPFPMFKR